MINGFGDPARSSASATSWARIHDGADLSDAAAIETDDEALRR